MSKIIKIENFDSEVQNILKAYEKEITGATKSAVLMTAKGTVKKLNETAPKRKGKYAKNWSFRQTHETYTSVECVVHNKKHYRLTHLLENGHNIVGRNGTVIGHTRAYPHIKPAEEYAEKEMLKTFENLLT